MSQPKRRRVDAPTNRLATLPAQLVGHVCGFCDTNSALSLLHVDKRTAGLRHSDARARDQVDMAVKMNICKHLRLWIHGDDWGSAAWLRQFTKIDMWDAASQGSRFPEFGLIGKTEKEIFGNLCRHSTSQQYSEAGAATALSELRTRRHAPQIATVSGALISVLLWNMFDPFVPLTRDIWSSPESAVDGKGGQVVAKVIQKAKDAIRHMSIQDVCEQWAVGGKGVGNSRYKIVRTSLGLPTSGKPDMSQCVVM